MERAIRATDFITYDVSVRCKEEIWGWKVTRKRVEEGSAEKRKKRKRERDEEIGARLFVLQKELNRPTDGVSSSCSPLSHWAMGDAGNFLPSCALWSHVFPIFPLLLRGFISRPACFHSCHCCLHLRGAIVVQHGHAFRNRPTFWITSVCKQRQNQKNYLSPACSSEHRKNLLRLLISIALCLCKERGRDAPNAGCYPVFCFLAFLPGRDFWSCSTKSLLFLPACSPRGTFLCRQQDLSNNNIEKNQPPAHCPDTTLSLDEDDTTGF